MRVADPWRVHTPTPCPACKLDDVALVRSDGETVQCRNCGADRIGYLWLDTDMPCRHCFQSNASLLGRTAIRSSHVAPRARERGNLDHLRYGNAFGRNVMTSGRHRRARQRPTPATRELVAHVTAGHCIHHLLRSIGVTPRYSDIPDRFFSEAPVRQLSLESFAARSDDDVFPMIWTDEIGRHEHDDHIIGLALHDRLVHALADEQSRRMRVAWLVPSCAACNQKRSKRLEDVAYLVAVFSLYLRTIGLEPHEEVEEVRMFVDAAKLAHVQLRLEAEYQRRRNAR